MRAEIFDIVSGQNDRREPVFSVIVKRSYRITGTDRPLERLECTAPLRKTDAYYDLGDPSWATVAFEEECAPFKPMTDLVVVGQAHAPGGNPVQEMVVSVQVGCRMRSIEVLGDRECRYRPGAPPVFTEPQPFERMPLRFENAYGGKDERSDPNVPFYYPRNHLGKGIALGNVKEVVEGLPLPNLEDAGDRLTPERVVLGDPGKWVHQPLPQGFGWYAKTWYPRTTFVGAYPPFVDADTRTPEEEGGLVPQDHLALALQFRLPSFDVRFNNGASPGLMFSALAPDEHITLRGLSVAGELSFRLPGDPPMIGLDTGLGETALDAVLHTVSIRPDESAVDMIWRGAYDYGGYRRLPAIKRLVATVR